MVSAGTLGKRIGYHFSDPDRLVLALTHRSWCSEHPDELSNERLEFLGDAVLGMIVTDHIFNRFPGLPEGMLAMTRASVVSSASLSAVGTVLRLGEALRLGRGEDISGGRSKPSIVADAVEAVIGAIYIDGGIESARRFVLDQLAAQIDEAARRPGSGDYKTRLQEMAARQGLAPPSYQISFTGPEHHKRFHATVTVGENVSGSGDGTSKKEAEQRAAEDAWNAPPPDNGD